MLLINPCLLPDRHQLNFFHVFIGHKQLNIEVFVYVIWPLLFSFLPNFLDMCCVSLKLQLSELLYFCTHTIMNVESVLIDEFFESQGLQGVRHS